MRAYNSTIKIKQKKCIVCGKDCVWFSKKRCQDCAKRQSVAESDKEDEEKESDESRQNLIVDCDTFFSKLIRLKYADKDGNCICYTSGKKIHWTQIQNGHFIPRIHLATRWLEDNCRPQSEYENCHKHGNLQEFEKRLEEEKPGIVAWLKEQSREVCKPTIDELKTMLADFKWKVKLLEKKLKK